ncbi:HlyD family efflux transporter periplasmic adaptor subunit [bacterium]|nr:HlyD family efflux transporter periplasmic adaptor subunit [bacterium]
MKRRTPIIATLLFATVIGGCGRDESNAVPLAEATRRSFDVVVYTNGEIDAADSIVISSPIKGERARIVWIAEDGSTVAAGDPLVRIDPSPFEDEVVALDAKMRELQASLDEQKESAEWELLQAERELKTAEFDLEAAESAKKKLEQGDGPLELARLEGAMLKAKHDAAEMTSYGEELAGLVKQGLANEAEVGSATRKAEESARSAEVAKQQYESYRDYVLPSAIEAVQASIARARMTLEQTRRGGEIRARRQAAERKRLELELEAVSKQRRDAALVLEQTTLRAPIPGMVVLQEDFRGGERRKPRPGDLALPERPLVYLPNIERVVVRGAIREVDLHQIDKGIPATVTVDAYPGLRLAGTVNYVGVMANDRTTGASGGKFFDVTVSVENDDARLRPGMTARMELAVGRADNQLSIPVQSVFLHGSESVVYTPASRHRFARRPVGLSLVGATYATVTDGLAEGDRVALSAPQADTIVADK